MERKNLLSFKGTGSTLFGLTIVNTILTVITLGLYYPWAKVQYLKYYYQNLHFSGDHFTFHGTGKEIFKGFIKGFIFIIVVVAIYFIFIKIGTPIVGALLYLIGLLLLLPIAMHGSYRYRLAKTSWRSIHFGYRGNLTELIKLCLKGFGLTIITLGIYAPWFEVKLKNYIYRHVRLGDLKFNFKGDGTKYFFLRLAGGAITYITLGIYFFWFAADLYRFHVENTTIEHNGQEYHLSSDVSGKKVFKLYFINALIIVFTLGLGFAWARVREMQFFADNTIIPEEIDTDNIVQTEEDYSDAAGDSALDFLDFNIIF